MVRRFCQRGPNLAVRVGDGGEFHGYQGLAGSHLLGGVSFDKGEGVLLIVVLFALGVSVVLTHYYSFNSQGKSAEEIRRIFNISNDFSPEEEDDQVVREEKS